ncbi:MAG: hypothetical protein J07HQW2_03516 [Haloquadratum walsbyi J07HQW2]|uniref:Uncharacterized protein n=1 Tax=Haloquadratum walsbyi J07HQW2 TaxID=1238425 RepID=U1NIJ9_9EURY|nr:MAG: hypothetical protein J07HQW2_03516 [Haloquadratum walsbyi J07HQW2]
MRCSIVTHNHEHDEPRITGEWNETEDEYEPSRLEDASDGYTIESEFRGGSGRVRTENGEYNSSL